MAIMDRTRLRLLLLLLGASMRAALAQISPEFAKVLTNPGEQRMVVDAAKQSSVILENPCAEGKFTIANKIAIIEAPVFDQAGTLRSGSWKQVVDYTGCNAPRTLNVLIAIVEGQRPNVRPLLPGTTMADARLQIDVFRSPVLQAYLRGWRDPSCTMAYVADTAFGEKESTTRPGARGPAWRETWTIAACDRRVPVSVMFAPDSTSTTFVIALPPATQGEPRSTPDRQ